MAKKGMLNHFDHTTLDRLMTEHSFTSTALAERLGMAASAVATWRGGKGKPRHDTLKAVAKVLKVAPEILSQDFGSPAPGTNGHHRADASGQLWLKVQDAKAYAGKQLFDDTNDPVVAEKLSRVIAYLNKAAGELK